MKRYNLLVKGNDIDAATIALVDRIAVEHFVFIRGDGDPIHDTMTLTVDVNSEGETLIHTWFGERPKIIEGYGFPAGTLLHFSEVQ